MRLGEDVPYRARGLGGGRARRAARRRRARGGLLPPRAGRGARRGARPARALPRRLLVPRPARSAARAAAAGARRRAAALSRRAVRGRAHARRRRPLALDPDRRARRGRAAEESRARGPGRAGACTRRAGSRACRSTSSAAPIPNWRFAEIAAEERAHDARSTFFLMAGHGHRADGAAPEAYDRLRPRLVETLLEAGAEVGSMAATSPPRTSTGSRASALLLAQLDGPLDRAPLPLPARRSAPEPRAARRHRLPLRHVARVPRRARLPGRHRAPVPSLGLRARPSRRPRRGAARRDGCDARRGALRGAVGGSGEAARARAPRLGGRARRRASRSSGIPSASTGRARAAGTGSTSS